MALNTASGPYLQDGRVVSPEGCELNAVHHCNLTCVSCSHLSPMFRKAVVDPAEAYADLSALAGHFAPRFVKILGGEPLLHPALIDLLDAVRASRIAGTLLVCTNGQRLPRMPAAFWERVDEVEISSYPGRELGEEDLASVARTAREHGVELRLFPYRAFRVSHVREPNPDPELVQRIYSTCQVAHVWRCHTVHAGHLFRCPQSVFLPLALDGGIDFADGLRIEDAPGFAERLLAYLTSPEPMAGCRRCLGTVGQLRDHEQEPRAGWGTGPELPAAEAVDHEHLERLERDPYAPDGCTPVLPVVLAPGR